MNTEKKEGPRFHLCPKTGNWHCYGARGLREDVKQQITSSILPERAKAYLVAKIDALPKECIGAKVDGYETSFPGEHDMTITTNTTVVGIKL